jgi:chaperonin GroEL
MAQDQRDTRIVLKGEAARSKILEGAQAIWETVGTTYGPKGQNVLAEKVYGRPLPTRDGVTVARETYFKDRPKNMGSQLVLEASETTNRIAGDGTSATAGLAYYLMKFGTQLINSGVNPMEVKQILIRDSEKLLERLDKLAKPVKKSQLREVATVSSGDPLLGELISEAVEYVGKDGGIMTEKSPVSDVEREYMDGYYLQQGFQALQTGRKEISDPFVLILEKRMTSGAEIAELLTKTLQTVDFKQETGIPRFLIVGNIEEQAYFSLVNLINQGKVDCIIVKTPPQFGEMGREVLADIATYAGCKVIGDTTNIQQSFAQRLGDKMHSPYIGTINRVVSNHNETTLFADNSTEAIKDRVQEIKDRLEGEISDAIAEKLRQRISMLEGKIAIFRIGGATDSEKEEKEFRIEDSINATRAAQRHGVVPGGAVTLVELSKQDISDTYKKALQAVFKKLLRNANLPVDVKLKEVMEAPYGQGFNLRESDELVDLVKAGILDPKLVISEIIKNATSVAHIALTTGVVLVFEDKQE